MSIFGDLFRAKNQASLQGEPFAIDDEFIEMAIELIDEFVERPNAVWVSTTQSSPLDADRPFESRKPNTSENEVKIVFSIDPLEDRQFQKYRKDTAMTDGQINGIMYGYEEFEPKLKDTIRFNGKTLTVNAIDQIQPVSRTILYILELGA